MPEVKNTFIQSKMNKDLDGRILPNGQYRDGENIQISRSEGDDVGALENALGNTLISDLNLVGDNLEAIGIYFDDTNDRVYIFLTKITNYINNQKLTDAHTCYKVFKTNIFKNIKLEEKGFSFCPEVTTKISNMNISIIEVPISYNGRDYKSGKKIKFSDAFKALMTLIKYKFFKK